MHEGLMCCDQNGLCLKSKGDMNPLLSGSYTAVIRLAAQLKGFDGTPTSPMVTIETNHFGTVIKQYDGHTVVMKAPSISDVTAKVMTQESESGNRVQHTAATRSSEQHHSEEVDVTGNE